MHRHAAWAAAFLSFAVVAGGTARAEKPAVVRVGAGSYLSALPPGAKGPPEEHFAAPDWGRPVPTNDWCSSLFWEKSSSPHYAHPLAMQATLSGLRVYYPGPAVTGTKDAIFGFMPGGKGDQADFVIGHADAETFDHRWVTGASDWSVDQFWASGTAAQMRATYGHGSPFVYVWFDGVCFPPADHRPARLRFADVPKVWAGDAKSARLGITVNGNKHYGLFAPDGATWAGLGTRELTSGVSTGMLVVALLPDADPRTLDLFARHARPRVARTRATWTFDPAAAEVRTRFVAELDPPPEPATQPTTRFAIGPNGLTPVPAPATVPAAAPADPPAGTLLALYPHQWRYADGVRFTGHTYASVRGTMKLAVVDPAFATKVAFPGVLPALPRVPGGADPGRLADYLRKEVAANDDQVVRDTYAEGKLLGKWASLIPIAEQYGLAAEADVLTKRIEARLEDWFTATDADGNPKMANDPKRRHRLFAYEPRWGTLIGYPAGFGSDVELNDHHFHYGYFVRAAAEVARRDPAWAADDRWGGMVKLLIRDIASPDRDDPLFPFLRNFDPYAGHSWASGHAKFGDGNNHESSSEAMNAWYGVLLWGQFTHDAKLRDLGSWLYTTEMTAIEDYWFGVHDDTFAGGGQAGAGQAGGVPAGNVGDVQKGGAFPAGYTPSVVTMVWGGKGANGTWFSAEPEAVHGINFLPVTGGSTYLGRFPAYADKNWRAMLAERKGGPLRHWPDVLLMYRALSDPADALARFDATFAAGPDGAKGPKPEEGNSLANAYHWIATLNALGQVDRTVTADHPLAVTFVRAGERTHVVYRGRDAEAGGAAKVVRFSDGVTVEAKAEGWVVNK